jgi:predicted DNA-binding transcriptional regulator AlpA
MINITGKLRFIPKRIKGTEVQPSDEPLPFDQLEEKALLDSTDIMRLFGISRPTFARYCAQEKLRPFKRVGRQMYFQKGAVQKWWQRKLSEKKKWPLYVQTEGRALRNVGYIKSYFGSGKSHFLKTMTTTTNPRILEVVNELLQQNERLRRTIELMRHQMTEALILNPPYAQGNDEQPDESASISHSSDPSVSSPSSSQPS